MNQDPTFPNSNAAQPVRSATQFEKADLPPSLAELHGSILPSLPVSVSNQPEGALSLNEIPAETLSHPLAAPPKAPTWRANSQQRKFVTSAVLFICSILFLRTVFLEPYGVPTGSMAPTLTGNHKCVECPRCGFLNRVGQKESLTVGGRKELVYPNTICQNCGKDQLPVSSAVEIPGDRLLVDKNVYRLRNPRRWEVAVFICPVDQDKPYVKRVIGLPNESVYLRGGDVYIDGRLERKTIAQARECRVLVFDNDYSPGAAGWPNRWLPSGTLPNAKSPIPPQWLKLYHSEIRIDGAGSELRSVGYSHVNIDTKQAEAFRDTFSYNGVSATLAPTVHDFMLECEVEIVDTQVGQVVLALTDGADLGTVSLPVNGEKRPATLSLPDQGIVRTEMLNPLLPHKKYTIEMAHVDRRITLTVNRSVVFQYDLPEMINRAEVSDPFRLGCQGGQVIFRKIKLYRDVYYRSNGSNGVAEPFPLREGEYFMLGDNSTESYDSRSWREPQVAEKGFLGKPFLLHQPMKPGRMSLWGFELGLQSIDWQRIRWLR